MKKLLGILVLSLLWCTASLTDDVKDFAIEGIYLDEDLDHTDVEKIFKKLNVVDQDFNIGVNNKDWFILKLNKKILNILATNETESWLYYEPMWDNIGRIQYEIFNFKKGLEVFDELQITIASLENTYKKSLVNVAGIYNFNSIEKCIEMKKDIENSVVDMFRGAKRGKDIYSSQSYDLNGRSKVLETYFTISNPDTKGSISVFCYDWDKDIIERHNWKNKLVLNINLFNLKLYPPYGSMELLYHSNKVQKVFEQISFVKKNKKYHSDDKYYALLIANGDYENWKDLKSPTNDVDAIYSELVNNYGFEVEVLKNSDRGDILNKLYEYSNKISSNDNLLIYYVGHGVILNNNAFWIPRDGTKKISSNWLNTNDVSSAISLIDAKDLLVMVDSCFQGTAFKGDDEKITEHKKNQTNDEEYFIKMVNNRSAVILTSGNNEPVVDAMIDNHSPFAFKFVDILKNNDKWETGTSVYSELKKYHANLSQNPNIIRKIDWHDLGGEFVFVKKK